MLIHQVFFQFNKKCTREYIENTILKNLLDLKKQIPQIIKVNWYRNITTQDLDQGFKYVAIFEFQHQEDLDKYLPHKAHQDFADNWLIPNLIDGLNSVVVFDFQV